MPRGMYQMEETCRKCGNKLYKTNLTGRPWCVECREYKDIKETGGIIKWLGRTK